MTASGANPGQEKPAGKSVWDRIKEVQGLITGGIAIVSAAITVGVVVIGYFATRSELKVIDCYYKNTTESITAQLSQLTLYSAYTVRVDEWLAKKREFDAAISDRDQLQLKLDGIKYEMDNLLKRKDVQRDLAEGFNRLVANCGRERINL